MTNLRKQVAIALQSANLSSNPTCETALDRIGALAFSDRLGATLWRAKYANDPQAYDPARTLLAHRLRGKSTKPNGILEKIAECVLNEWLDDLCKACGGRGHLVPQGTPHARRSCTRCAGTGQRRSSDRERIRVTGISATAYPKWERFFTRAHSLLATADRQACFDVAMQLERVGVEKESRVAILPEPAAATRCSRLYVETVDYV
jgi:hypothetical protein